MRILTNNSYKSIGLKKKDFIGWVKKEWKVENLDFFFIILMLISCMQKTHNFLLEFLN